MLTKLNFKIHGMDCTEEVAVLKKVLNPIEGIEGLSFDVLNAKMIVTVDTNILKSQKIIDTVKNTGMKAELWEHLQNNHTAATFWSRNGRTLLTIASGVFIAIGFLIHTISNGFLVAIREGDVSIPIISKVFYAFAAILGFFFVLPKAWFSIKRRIPDMNLLMTIAVVGAASIGQWLEAATVAFLFALSILLEAWSVGRARRAVTALMAITPPKARIIGEDLEEMVNVAEVSVGSRILVKPGEKFPLDGKILSGTTSVNQAPITGESKPVDKIVGSEVFAGTINGEATVTFESTKIAADTTVARIIHLVQEAQSRRSPSEQWVEHFARIYTPVVMILALGVIILPPAIAGGEWSKWFYEGLVLLVIACPCALVISTPVSIVAALTSAAKNGVLIKGGLFVEVPAKIKAFAFDKTGTLTEGQPVVSDVIPFSGHSKNELIEIASAIESQSEHPLAKAIVKYAKSLGLQSKPASNFKIIPGKGATAILDNKEVWIGSHKFLEERSQETSEMHEQLEALSSAGSSIVVVGNDKHVCGFISVSDKIRNSSKRTIAKLKRLGIETVVMLTGDNEGTARSVASATGVSNIYYELLPENKLRIIEDLVKKHGQVAMVGDGVNDAPAMARASLGIAMGAAGSDAAIETSDIALMSDDLSSIPWLVAHSRRTLKIIRQNITASLLVKAIFVILTFMGHSSLWTAIAADMGVSLLVVFNALRLLDSHSSEFMT